VVRGFPDERMVNWRHKVVAPGERMNACLTPEYSKLDMVNSKSDVLACSRVAAKPLPAEVYKQFQTFEFREPYRMDGVQSFGENGLSENKIGRLCLSAVQSTSEKSLLLQGLISRELIQRIRSLGQSGGESVSQSPLKDKVFSTFLDQNPPFELQPGPKWNFTAGKSLFSQWCMIDNNAPKRLAKANCRRATAALARPFVLRRMSMPPERP
jgi:hypothetical protein